VRAFVRATWLLDDWGRVVSEPDLVKALKERKIAGAALDVQTVEPPPVGSPLLELDNVIVTPHIASFTREAQEYSDRIVQQEAIRFMRGQQLRFLANPEVL
jgi:phosphoglycerate dehydrogenase-like enzyme